MKELICKTFNTIDKFCDENEGLLFVLVTVIVIIALLVIGLPPIID